MAASRSHAQAEHIKAPDYAAIGGTLQETRGSYGLSVEQAAKALHVKPGIVTALEKGKLDEIPGGMVYAKGHLRSYAHYLGVNLDTMLSLLTVQTEIKPVASVSLSHSEPRRTRIAVTLSLLVIVGFALSWLISNHEGAPEPVLVKPVPPEYSAYLESGEAPGLSSSCISVSEHPAWPPCFATQEHKRLMQLQPETYMTILQVK